MRIHNINLHNFRNHGKYTCVFENDLTIIYGVNGAGKTNLLEAIYVLATSKSPRTKYDSDLIELKKNFATITGVIDSNGDEYNLELQVLRSELNPNLSVKKAKVNKVIKTIAYFCGVFNAVLFTPQDIDIITGSPGVRRRYLDLLLAQIDPNYKKSLSLYNKSLKQRNKLLEDIRKEGRGRDQIPFWDNIIVQNGLILQSGRQKYINYINSRLSSLTEELDKKHKEAKIIYKENEISQDKLDKHLEIDIRAQTTLIGPHRDDFHVELGTFDVGQFGSRGQQRTLLLCLKLLEIEYFEQERGQRPVLLLDDIFSELDSSHKNAVMEVIGKQQTIITSAEDIRELGLELSGTPHVIRL